MAGSLQNQLEAHEGARSKALKRVEATFAQERAAHAQEVARLQRSEAAAVERLGTEAAARACAEADLVTLRAHLASVQKSAEADRQRLQSSMHAQVQEQVKQMEVQATRLGEENGRLQGSLQGLEGGRDREREQHAQQMQQASSAFQGLQAELAAAHAHAAALEARFAEQERLRRCGGNALPHAWLSLRRPGHLLHKCLHEALQRSLHSHMPPHAELLELTK